jgi:hypothetical protein
VFDGLHQKNNTEEEEGVIQQIPDQGGMPQTEIG